MIMVSITLIQTLLNFLEMNMDQIGRPLLNITYTKKERKMIKKLLNQLLNLFSYDYDRKQIENYLAKSSDLTDLENRIKELDRKGAYNRFYI